MANNSGYSLGAPCQSIAQRKVANEATIRPEILFSTALDKKKSCTSAITGAQDVPVKSRAYQLEMLEESLKRNIIVAVCFLLLLFDPPLSWQ